MSTATIRFASWRWMVAGVAALLIAAVAALALASPRAAGTAASPAAMTVTAPAGQPVNVTPALARLAQRDPSRRVEVIVQLQRGTAPARGRVTVKDLGGKVVTELHVINALAAEMSAGQAVRLARDSSVYAVTLNGSVHASGDLFSLASQLLSKIKPDQLPDLLPRLDERLQGVGRGDGRGRGSRGPGHRDRRRPAGLPHVDERQALAGDRLGGRQPRRDHRGRQYGHGTHVAGLIAGNGFNRDHPRPALRPLRRVPRPRPTWSR